MKISLRYAEMEREPVQICCGAAPPTAALQHTSTLLLCSTCSDSESLTSRKFELHFPRLNDRKDETLNVNFSTYPLSQKNQFF